MRRVAGKKIKGTPENKRLMRVERKEGKEGKVVKEGKEADSGD